MNFEKRTILNKRITIIGAGPGGYIAAIKASQMGAAVTIIEQDAVGGTCLNRGCIPTKTIKASGDAIEAARRLSDFGILLEGQVYPDMAAIMNRKNKIMGSDGGGIRIRFSCPGYAGIHC